MSFIQVPIGKGIGKNLRESEDFKARLAFKESQLQVSIPNNQIQYLKNLSDTNRLVIGHGSATQAQTVVTTITPPNGSTFYLLGAVVNQVDTDAALDNVVNLIKRGVDIVESKRLVGNVPSVKFELQFDRLIGDGVLQYAILIDNQAGNGEVDGTIWGFIEETSALQTETM